METDQTKRVVVDTRLHYTFAHFYTIERCRDGEAKVEFYLSPNQSPIVSRVTISRADVAIPAGYALHPVLGVQSGRPTLRMHCGYTGTGNLNRIEPSITHSQCVGGWVGTHARLCLP